MKIDLHCHSYYSARPSDWFLKKIGASESYTAPEDLYNIQKSNGMDMVTITDHNTIDGCLDLIKNHNDVFISCEYTTYLQPSKCKLHVLCWNITEAQHEEIMTVREDLYRLVEFLNLHNINYGLAHPLFSINGRLNPERFHEIIQLFDVFEINAAKDAFSNEYLELILSKAKPRYSLSSGSDDHSGLTLSRGYTEVDTGSLEEFFTKLRQGDNTIVCRGSTPHTLARHIYSIALQWLRESGKVNNYPKIFETYLLPESKLRKNGRESLVNRVKSKHPKFWTKNVFFRYLSKKLESVDSANKENGESNGERFFNLIEQSIDKYVVDLGNNIVNDLMEYKLLDMFRSIGIAVFLYVLLAPYFIAFSIFGAQRKLSRKILNTYVAGDVSPIRVAKFTDNFGKIDGVSKTLEEQVTEARKSHRDYTIITCAGSHLKDQPGVSYFEPIGVFSAPEYSEQPICWPPIIKILDYCYREQFTHIQTATPGPMGLLAMAVAHTLGLPLHATYHTQIPQFIGEVTEEGFLEDVAWQYMMWFYGSCDIVFAPSEHTKDELVSHGLDASKVKVYPRGIDTDRFHPSNRDRQWLKDTYQIPLTTKVFLYVGRVSKEKNIKTLVDAYRIFHSEHPYDNVMIITGGGDYLEKLKEITRDIPVVFTGPLEGKDLDRIFASSDVFTFASLRDTHGRVILEAAASGLPCIVSNEGGPRENVKQMDTGFIVDTPTVEKFSEAFRIMYLTDTSEMSKKARLLAEEKSFSKAFEAYWKMYE